MSIRWISVVALCGIISMPAFATERQIAITIDDLPFVGSGTSTPKTLKRTKARFMSIVNALVDNQVPATGFAIGGAVARNQWDFLETFRNQPGLTLGNHTYTHLNLNTMSVNKYIADIDRADKVLARVMTEPKYFRYPYLAESKGTKKNKVRDYLAEHHYTIAPVTIDTKDYRFNVQFFNIAYSNQPKRIEQFKNRYLAYIWKQTLIAEKSTRKGKEAKQILLIHANLLNSVCLDDIIKMYKKNGYTFITLEEALKPDENPIQESALTSVPVFAAASEVKLLAIENQALPPDILNQWVSLAQLHLKGR